MPRGPLTLRLVSRPVTRTGDGRSAVRAVEYGVTRTADFIRHNLPHEVGMSVLRSLRWLAVAAVAFVLAGPVSAQAMRVRITAEQLNGLLRDKGMEGQVNERGNVVVNNGGSKIIFFISGQTL